MKYEQGYTAIASVLVIAAVVFIVSTSVSLLSVGDIQSAFSSYKSAQALSLVEGCAEDALLRLNETASIPAVINIPQGTCAISVNSQTGNDWILTVTGTFENYTKSLQIQVARSSNVDVSAWREL